MNQEELNDLRAKVKKFSHPGVLNYHRMTPSAIVVSDSGGGFVNEGYFALSDHLPALLDEIDRLNSTCDAMSSAQSAEHAEHLETEIERLRQLLDDTYHEAITQDAFDDEEGRSLLDAIKAELSKDGDK